MPFLKKGAKELRRSRVLENLAKKNGLRHAFFNAGDKYIGEWKYDEKSGKGSLLTKARQIYEGDFERGYRHGFGVLAYELPCKVFTLEYRGEWKNGCMHGIGLRIFRDGSFYLGEWKHGKRDGYGQMWYSDGGFFDGDWVKDKKEGPGMYVRPDGNRYEGHFKNDMKHGKGTFFHLDSGQMQDGVWHDDVCIYSLMTDIPFRQAAVVPTTFPIQQLKLFNPEEVCTARELKALSEEIKSCLSFHVSLDGSDTDNMRADPQSVSEAIYSTSNTYPSSHIYSASHTVSTSVR